MCIRDRVEADSAVTEAKRDVDSLSRTLADRVLGKQSAGVQSAGASTASAETETVK